MPVLVLPRHIEAAYPVSHSGNVLMRQFLTLYGLSVKRSRHYDKGSVSAFRCLFAERLVKIKKFSETGSAAHIHDPLVVYGAFFGKAVRPVGLKLMRKVPARDKNGAPSKVVRRFLKYHPVLIVLK